MRFNKYLFFLFVVICVSYFMVGHKFNFRKIYFPQEYLVLNANNEKLDSKIISQEFSYLDKGSQFFVFESSDKKFVIKFMRYDKVQCPKWAMLLSYFSFSKEAINKKKKRFFNALKSSRLAAKTKLNFGIVLHNFDGKFFKKRVIIIDKCKNKIEVDLNKTIFLVQKKAIGLKEALNTAELEEQQLIISEFFQNTQKCFDQKIYNNTRKCMENVGLNEDGITEFDIGDIHYLERLDDIEVRNAHFKRFTKPLREYLVKELPNLVDHFDNIEKLYSN